MFQLQARDVQCMRSYAAAKRRFEELVKGDSDGKYLSRNKSLQITMEGNDVVCTYNRNKVVYYRPDDTVLLRTCGWPTPSTARFIAACTGIRTSSIKGTLYAYLSGYYPADGLVVDMKSMKPVNPTQQQRRVLDKAAAKEIRKPYAAFIKQMMAISKAMEAKPGMSEGFRDLLPKNAQRVDKYILRDLAYGMEEDGEGEMRDLATNWLLWQATAPVEMKTFGRSRYRPEVYYAPVENRMRVAINKVMKQVYIDEDARTWEDVPLGELPKKDYG